MNRSGTTRMSLQTLPEPQFPVLAGTRQHLGAGHRSLAPELGLTANCVALQFNKSQQIPTNPNKSQQIPTNPGFHGFFSKVPQEKPANRFANFVRGDVQQHRRPGLEGHAQGCHGQVRGERKADGQEGPTKPDWVGWVGLGWMGKGLGKTLEMGTQIFVASLARVCFGQRQHRFQSWFGRMICNGKKILC